MTEGELRGQVEALQRRVAELEGRLAERDQALRALLQGEVDAVLPSEACEEGLPTLLRSAQEALSRSERQLRAIFEGSQDAILVIDATSGAFLDVNPAACALFGVPREELLGRTATEFADPELDRSSSRRELTAEGSVRGNFMVLRPGGDRRLTEFSSVAEVQPGRHLAILRDMTQARRAEDQLRDRERQLRAVFEGALDGLLVADDEGRYVDANPAACALLGLPREELLGRSMAEFAATEAYARAGWTEFRHSGRAEGEMTLVRADGQRVQVEFRAIADVLPGLHLSSLRDLTERRRAEAARGLADERFATVFRASPLPIAIFTASGTPRYVDVNPAFLLLVGLERDQVAWRNVEELPFGLQPALCEHVLEHLSAGGTGRLGVNLDTTWATKHGPREVLLSFQLIELAGERCVLSFANDVTEREEERAARRVAEERLGVLVNHLPAVVFSVGADGRFTLAEGLGLTAIGRRPGDLVGVLLTEAYGDLLVTDGEGRVARAPEVFARVFAGEIVRGEFLIEETWFDAWFTPLRNDEGEVVGATGVALDVTERRLAAEAQRTAEQRLGAVLEHAPLVVYGIDREGRFVLSTGRGLERTGLRPGELVGRSSFESYGDIRYVLRDGSVLSGEECMRRALEGEVVGGQMEVHGTVFENWLVPMRDAAGQVTGATGISMDVTDRRAAERALASSEQRHRRLLEAGLLGVVAWDADGRITEANEAFLELTGYDRADLDASRVRWREHPEPAGRNFPRLDLQRPHEVDLLRADGQAVPVLVGTARLDPERGGGAAFVLDLSERKRAERALQQTSTLLSTLFQASPAAILAIDREGGVTHWNAAAEAVFGWSAEEVLGQPLPILPPEERAGALEGIVAGASVVGESVRRLRKDGSLVELSRSIAPLRDAAGEVIGAVGVLLDLTERRGLEDRFREAQKMEAVGQLAGGIAHDFNNMLSVILGFASMLKDALPPSDSLRADAEQIIRAADRATSLTRQLLAFSRRQVLQPRVVDLNQLLGELERMLRRVIGEHVELVTCFDPAAGPIKADPGQLEQVLLNLAVNAEDAMSGRGGVLTIATRDLRRDPGAADLFPGCRAARCVEITVSDTGHGMSPEVRERAFEPFFTTKEEGKGTGLGLASVYGIVVQSGGHIEVESTPGEGTAFRIVFPCTDEPLVPEERPSARIEREKLRGPETVLVVEDQDLVRELAGHVLRRAGYAVLEAVNGEEALKIIEDRARAVDLMLTDVIMPKLTGHELARRARGLRPRLPILFMSGYTEHALVETEGLDPESELIEKPFTPQRLLLAVRTGLDRAAAARHTGTAQPK